MHRYFVPPLIPLTDSAHWNISTELVVNQPSKESNKQGVRARNRVAAKKWRSKKDEALYQLEAMNDQLRQEALQLRKAACELQTENQILEDELKFFQSFMSTFMSGTVRKEGRTLLARSLH
jgi:uncharacterized protein YllA (UPF0747 family)